MSEDERLAWVVQKLLDGGYRTDGDPPVPPEEAETGGGRGPGPDEAARGMLRLVRESAGREVMNAKEAADFLRLAPSSFGALAPSLPRTRLREEGGYRYLRSDLPAWLEERREGPGTGDPRFDGLSAARASRRRGPRKRVRELPDCPGS